MAEGTHNYVINTHTAERDIGLEVTEHGFGARDFNRAGTWRDDLADLIDETPHLDWLLLTKRPSNIAGMLPQRSHGALTGWGPTGYPNVWLGTTVENQAEADRRIPHLLAVPAARRFLSCEPLLGPLPAGRAWRFPAPHR